MKNILVSLIFSFCSIASAQSQEEIATAVVQAQLEAYNAKDINAFMKVFSKDAAIFNFGETKPIASGEEAVRKVYANLFKKSPDLHSLVINRSVIGSKVLDYELITGRQGQTEALKLIAIYEVENGLITKATFIRE